MRKSFALITLLSVAAPSVATAQDVVVMRRQIAPPNRIAQAPAGGQASSHRWRATGSYGAWSSTCSANATRAILYDCTRASDGGIVSADLCAGIARTERTAPSEIYDGCTYTKVLGSPGPYSTTCGAGATRTTVNSCSRDLDLVRVDPPTYCSIPSIVTDRADVYSGCTGTWKPVIDACGTDDVQRTYFTCRDASGASSPDACDPTRKPADVGNACAGTWNSYLAACSSSGTHQPVVRCLDPGGAQIEDSNCNPAKRPSTTPVDCTGTWRSTPGTCTGGSQTPVVTCQKNGTAVAEGMCNPATKPSAAPVSCVMPATTCGTMTQRWFGPAGGNSINIGTANDVATARSTCVSKLSENGAGTCGWNSSQKIAYFWKGTNVVNRGTDNTDHLWGAYCQ